MLNMIDGSKIINVMIDMIDHIFNKDNFLIVIAVFFATFVYRKPSLFFTGSATPTFQMPAVFYTNAFQQDLSMKIGEMLMLLPLSVLCGTLCRYYFLWRQSLAATRDKVLKINNPFAEDQPALRKAFQFVQRWIVGCGNKMRLRCRKTNSRQVTRCFKDICRCSYIFTVPYTN